MRGYPLGAGKQPGFGSQREDPTVHWAEVVSQNPSDE